MELRYIELKTGRGDRGPAWIARVHLSRSGRTVYFNGKALKQGRGGASGGNYRDLETGDEYWVSRVKRDGQDRHWAGGGVVWVERSAVAEYLHLTGRSGLDARTHEEVEDLPSTDIDRLTRLENS